jgi:hypothetical protein
MLPLKSLIINPESFRGYRVYRFFGPMYQYGVSGAFYRAFVQKWPWLPIFNRIHELAVRGQSLLKFEFLWDFESFTPWLTTQTHG